MRINRLRSVILAAASVFALLVGQLGGVATAATTTKTSTPTTTGEANSLKVSPLRSDLSIAKGNTGTTKVQVTNLTKSTVILKAIENDFVAGDEKGTPALILDENSYAPSHSLKRFMVSIPNITVAPNQTQEVTVTVRVPANAQAGGYFGALRFAPASLTGSTLSVGASVASLILLTVPGPTVEQLTLTNFDVQQSGGTATNFRTPNNLSLMLRFQNKGNLQEAPFGQINVLKGKKVVYKASFNQNDPKNEILPDSARRWSLPIKNLGKFGKYTINGTFTYGTQSQSVEITKTIWIIPTTVIMIGVAALLITIAIGVGFWLFIRSYKRKILRSSRRRY